MSRDPLDTNLSAMIDQAQSIAVQLRVVQAARDALPAIGADADGLAATLVAAADVAADAQAASDTAAADSDWAADHDRGLRREALRWGRGLEDALRVAAAEPALRSWVEQLAAMLPTARTPRGQLVAAVERAWRGLTDPASPLSDHPALAGSRALGGEVVPPLLAHEAVRAEIVRVAGAAVAARAAARAGLLATLRAVRASWRAAAAVAPGRMPDLDLRLVAAAATARRSRPASPAVDGGAASGPEAAPHGDPAAASTAGASDAAAVDPHGEAADRDREAASPAGASQGAADPDSDPRDRDTGALSAAAPGLADDGAGDRLQIHIVHERA